MEGVLHADDPVPPCPEALPGVAPHQLDGPLVDFGAAVGEKDPVGKGQAHQRLGQLHHGGGVVDVGHMDQLRQLGRSGAGDLRVSMAQVDHRQPGQAVQVLFAGVVPNPAAITLDQHQRLPAVGMHNDFISAFHPVIVHVSFLQLIKVIHKSGNGFLSAAKITSPSP